MSVQPQHRQLGELEAYEIRTGDDRPTVVLFHGYGANAFDLMPLSQYAAADVPVNWLFPQGLVDLDLGWGMVGKAWFSIDVEALQEAMLRGEYRDLAGSRPPGLDRARDAAVAMLDAYGAPLDQLILGGFSQGAMLATEVTLQAEHNPRALLLLSGTLLDRSTWERLAPKRKGLRFFQSHGTGDPLLPHAAAEQLHKLLTDAGWRGDFHSFRGAHEIPPAIAQRLGAFVREVL